jgi:hypothetical protein
MRYWLGGARWIGPVRYGNGLFDDATSGIAAICLQGEDTDVLPAFACLAKPSMSELGHKGCIRMNGA